MNKGEISVAPMMDWTDRHCRYFLRQVSPSVRLYTEMITSAALVHGDAEKLLRFDPAEHPVALQLGGNDPRQMAAAARLGRRPVTTKSTSTSAARATVCKAARLGPA